MVRSAGGVGDHPFGIRNARWRAWLRVRTPDFMYYRLGLVVPKAGDCGLHEWHAGGDESDACYHCRATRPTPADAPRSATAVPEDAG
jgi:hypothetical protein